MYLYPDGQTDELTERGKLTLLRGDIQIILDIIMHTCVVR
jgi:hypothetical protein